MKIRMRTQAAGPTWQAAPGEIIDRPEEEAQALIKGGFAAPAREYETASAPATPETADIKPARRRRDLERLARQHDIDPKGMSSEDLQAAVELAEEEQAGSHSGEEPSEA